jgi:[protein-PII] uridylyltransferase
VNTQYANALEAGREEFNRTGDSGVVMAARGRFVDDVVLTAYTEFLAPAFPDGIAVLAVGGYGRLELFPHSDIDILLLTEKAPHSRDAKEGLSNFLKAIWDSGLRLSHSVHNVQECVELHEQNIELNVSLLDERFLCGDRSEYARLEEKLPRFISAERLSLIKHLERLTNMRHGKYHATIHHLEPNIKETPGGLRDLHLVGWLSKLADPHRAAPSWMDGLAEAKAFLYSIRFFLHYQSARDNNLLSFDAQESLVEQPFIETPTAAELMRRYYRGARTIHRAALRAIEESTGKSSSMLQSFRDWRSRLSNSEFTVSRDQILLKTPNLLEQDPEASLRLIRFVARHGIAPGADTERRIEAALPAIARYFSEPRPLWNYLQEIFRMPLAIQGIRIMHETGLMGALFPEWREIECLVQRDFYHCYTVDEHTLITIENLLALKDNKEPQMQRFQDLLAEIDQVPLLMFALLFHDTGKGNAGASHAQESVLIANPAMERIQMPEEQRETVRMLIDQHLVLSSIMNSRDLDDPSTATFLAGRVGTIERLKYLTLMTYSDISAVNPSAMTPWRLEQLWRVFILGNAELTRELDSDRIAKDAAAPAPRAEFLEGFPKRYLRTHSPDEIEAHLSLERRSRAAGVALDIVKDNGVYKLTLVSTDRAGLFAAIAGTLSSFGMNILKAEAFANRRGEILDTFSFSDPGRMLELNPPELERLRITLERVTLGRIDVKKLLLSRPKSSAPSRGSIIKPNVIFDSDASSSATLVELVAQDRPGLLYDLASAFSSSDCNIEVVLIDTEAHKALDVFYITSKGQKLTHGQQTKLEKQLIQVCNV